MHLILCIGIFFTVVELSRSQTMDELIAAAAVDSHQMDFLRDDDTVMVEMDILYKKSEWNRITRERNEMENETAGFRYKRKALRYEARRWTNKIVPYQFASSFSSRDMSQFRAAVADYHKYTCLKLQQRSRTRPERNYVSIVNGGGCSSFVGMIGGGQRVTLAPGCRRKGVIIHELGHAIGFHHEQTRPDRDQHVRILEQNVVPRTLFNFRRYSTRTINTHGVPYDLTSVMHYGERAFSQNGQRTIVALNPRLQSQMGNRFGFSFNDVKLANIIYKCSERCGSKTCPNNGFVGKDCKCYCKGNPVKLCSGGGGGGGGNEECKNDHHNCDMWAANGDCQSNSAFMNTNCRLACNHCTKECEDGNRHCSYWKNRGFCTDSRYESYMKTNCQKACGTCGKSNQITTTVPDTSTTTTTITTKCEDGNRQCLNWNKRGFCTNRRYRTYMRTNCRKSCGTCQNSNQSIDLTTRPTTSADNTSAATTTSSCRDFSSRCGNLIGREFLCKRSRMLPKYCPKTCRVC